MWDPYDHKQLHRKICHLEEDFELNRLSFRPRMRMRDYIVRNSILLIFRPSHEYYDHLFINFKALTYLFAYI